MVIYLVAQEEGAVGVRKWCNCKHTGVCSQLGKYREQKQDGKIQQTGTDKYVHVDVKMDSAREDKELELVHQLF